MTRPKIFCQFADFPGIGKTNGDRINEIRFYRTLSTFADVYFNDIYIDWKTDFVGVNGERGQLNPPSRKYDLYYVRGNKELFMRLPHPKIATGIPYDPDIYAEADGIVLTTQPWADLLESYNTSKEAQKLLGKWYPEKISEPKSILNFRQAIDPIFLGSATSRQLFSWRTKTTMAKSVFGFFGRITDETIPQRLVTAVSRARDRIGSDTDPLVAFAGNIRAPLPSYTLNLGRAQYSEMPALLSVCRATLGQECADSGFLGSGKTVDSIARCIPVVSSRLPVRVEQLGANYPGFFDTQEEADNLVFRICTDIEFYNSLVAYLKTHRNTLLPESLGAEIHNSLVENGLL